VCPTAPRPRVGTPPARLQTAEPEGVDPHPPVGRRARSGVAPARWRYVVAHKPEGSQPVRGLPACATPPGELPGTLTAGTDPVRPGHVTLKDGPERVNLDVRRDGSVTRRPGGGRPGRPGDRRANPPESRQPGERRSRSLATLVRRGVPSGPTPGVHPTSRGVPRIPWIRHRALLIRGLSRPIVTVGYTSTLDCESW
jgi:hypothetical protein